MFEFCVSPTINGTRCQEFSVGDSKFCVEHSNKFKKKYILYKYLEKNIDITPKTSEEALILYGKLRKAFRIRSDYRKKAFVPEMWDRGHDLRMSYILDKMSECEELLRMWFNEDKETNNNKKESLELLVNKDEKETDNLEEISSDYNKIKKEENDFDLILSNAIKEEIKNIKKICSDINEYDKQLQSKLGLEYTKDFYVFVCTLDLISISYPLYIDNIKRRNYTGFLGFFFGPVIEFEFNRKNLDIIRFFIIKTGLKCSKTDISLHNLHSLFSLIKDKKILYFRYLKETCQGKNNKIKDYMRLILVDNQNKYLGDIISKPKIECNRLTKINLSNVLKLWALNIEYSKSKNNSKDELMKLIKSSIFNKNIYCLGMICRNLLKGEILVNGKIQALKDVKIDTNLINFEMIREKMSMCLLILCSQEF